MGNNQMQLPKDGFFSTITELKAFFQFHKKTHEDFKGIPLIFQYLSGRGDSKGAFLYFLKPQMQSQTVYGQIMRSAILRQKQLDRYYQDLTSIMIRMISQKNTYRFIDNHFYLDKKGRTIQQIYQHSKDEEGFLHYQYQFSYELPPGHIMFPGYLIAAMIILALPIMPFMGMYDLYNWTSHKLSNPSEISFSFSSPVQHRFKYKQKYSLAERERKLKINQIQSKNIVIILEKHFKSKLTDLPIMKFIIKSKYNYLQLCTMLRAKILTSTANQAKGNSKSKESIFFIIGGKLPNHQTAMEQIYHKFKDYDGMLYISYQQQESF